MILLFVVPTVIAVISIFSDWSGYVVNTIYLVLLFILSVFHPKLGERKNKVYEYESEEETDLEALLGLTPPKKSRTALTSQTKMYVWQRDGGRCVECGSRENLEYDHIIPFSLGGSNTERNIQLLCENCNRSKRDRIQ